MFETDGSIAETEIWVDSRVLQGAYRRGNTYQTVLARLDSSQTLRHVPRLADRESAGQRPGAPRRPTTTRSSRAR